MDHNAAETRQDKVSLFIVPKLCGGQVWGEGFLQDLSLKVADSGVSAKLWHKTLVCQQNSGVSLLALNSEESDTEVKNLWTFRKTGKNIFSIL